MRLIDRLSAYLERKKITPYSFERLCGVSNGYLGKQLKGKGSVGSDILEKIGEHYPDLNLVWLITGKGTMLQPVKRNKSNEDHDLEVKEDVAIYAIRNRLIEVLKEQLEVLETSLPDIPGRRKSAKRRKSARK